MPVFDVDPNGPAETWYALEPDPDTGFLEIRPVYVLAHSGRMVVIRRSSCADNNVFIAQPLRMEKKGLRRFFPTKSGARDYALNRLAARRVRLEQEIGWVDQNVTNLLQ